MVKEFKSGFGFDCLMRIFAPDYNHLKIQVTDYHSNTFEDPKSVMQLDDLRDCIGIGGSWTELVEASSSSSFLCGLLTPALPCFTTDKLAGRDPASTKVTNRVVSAFHRCFSIISVIHHMRLCFQHPNLQCLSRAKVRGALLQDTQDDENN
ncbi:hypothetical protein NC652_019499 [Populus alba x Populus x berolinensis]|uniref:Uncharacterized protein n=1 Tax=Populus tomentosa TaxID=118781 RepID=A0A8X7ZIY1_POPTO|nr:hypothetical protein POTOM_027449 [Populus tomentosa]KAJ6917133.1 hypothetical protein NC652_019499 [Populus alba x Populus x berolinensis]